nr:cytochrome P450 monooxygenase [Thamnidium elegans]
MSLQSSMIFGFLKTPLETMIQLYTTEVIPHLTKRNKTIGITTAIVLSSIYFIRDTVFKPPRNLRHLPYFGYFSVIRSLMKGESMFDRGYSAHIPLVNARPDGLYVEPGKVGWEVHVSNPEDVKHILLKTDVFPKADFNKGSEFGLLNKFVAGPNVIIISGDHWKSQRKVINPAFRRSMPVKLFGQLTQELFLTIEKLGSTVDVSDLMMRCTLDAIGRAGFGFDFSAIRDSNSHWTTLYNELTEGFRDYKFFIFPVLDQSLLWLFPKRKILHQKLDIFMDKLDQVIQSKRNQLSEGHTSNIDLEHERDLLTLMIESEQRGDGALTDLELKSNLCLFFFAGHDTTSSALSFAIYHLAKHPEIQERARAEAIDILGDEPTDILPTAEEIKRMSYINQVMKETLRITGPVPRLGTRIATEDTILSGTFIPKGTSVLISVFNTHHSDKIWHDPETFNPDRFSDEQGAQGWLPFGGGSRLCIGMNFSLNEQRVMISMLLRKYKWSFPEGSSFETELVTSGVPVVAPEGLKMTFKKRY